MTHSLAPNSEQACVTILNLLNTLRGVHNEFPIQYAVCLIEISCRQGISPSDLAQRTGLAISTVSRIIGALSDNRQKGKAFDLVNVRISEKSRRSKQLFLTPSGEKICRRLAQAIQTPP